MRIDFDLDKDIITPSIQLDANELDKVQELITMAQQLKIKNPAVTFTDLVKNCKCDDMSDDQYEELISSIRMLSEFWVPENEGLAPAARLIYKTRGIGDTSKKNKFYVAPSYVKGGKYDANVFLILERLIAYAMWHQYKDTVIMASIDELADTTKDIIDSVCEISKEAYDAKKPLKAANEVTEVTSTKPRKKNGKTVKKSAIDEDEVNDIVVDKVANLSKEADHLMAIMLKVNGALDAIRKSQHIIDKTDDDAYVIRFKDLIDGKNTDYKWIKTIFDMMDESSSKT